LLEHVTVQSSADPNSDLPTKMAAAAAPAHERTPIDIEPGENDAQAAQSQAGLGNEILEEGRDLTAVIAEVDMPATEESPASPKPRLSKWRWTRRFSVSVESQNELEAAAVVTDEEVTEETDGVLQHMFATPTVPAEVLVADKELVTEDAHAKKVEPSVVDPPEAETTVMEEAVVVTDEELAAQDAPARKVGPPVIDPSVLLPRTNPRLLLPRTAALDALAVDVEMIKKKSWGRPRKSLSKPKAEIFLGLLDIYSNKDLPHSMQNKSQISFESPTSGATTTIHPKKKAMPSLPQSLSPRTFKPRRLSSFKLSSFERFTKRPSTVSSTSIPIMLPELHVNLLREENVDATEEKRRDEAPKIANGVWLIATTDAGLLKGSDEVLQRSNSILLLALAKARLLKGINEERQRANGTWLVAKSKARLLKRAETQKLKLRRLKVDVIHMDKDVRRLRAQALVL
jgi:hypothetical protein